MTVDIITNANIFSTLLCRRRLTHTQSNKLICSIILLRQLKSKRNELTKISCDCDTFVDIARHCQLTYVYEQRMIDVYRFHVTFFIFCCLFSFTLFWMTRKIADQNLCLCVCVCLFDDDDALTH